MSDWYWKVIALKAVFILVWYMTYVGADDVQKLPFCNPSSARDGPAFHDLMIVSTLDGKLTAFSTQNGMKAWDLETQPLLSSNLHNLELTSGGKWVRLVPSLRGTLYSLSGDTIEPLPFDSEQLLSSSYKYSDDLVIAGAKETVWLGIDAHTGTVIYECGSRGCNSEHAATSGSRDVLVLRRHSNTVRALDPRAGDEKWNFSVAEHKLALNRGECVGPAPATAPAPVAVTVALHDGRFAIRTPGGNQVIWQQKLEAPVAGMWRLQGGSLQNIDVLWEATQSISSELVAKPSLYIGVHNTQLYIQESPLYTQKLETAVAPSSVPWKLVSGRPMLENNAIATRNENELSQVSLYGAKGMISDYGFFLYLQDTCDQAVQTTEDLDRDMDQDNESDNHDHHHIHVHVYSLWFWWKEVLLIAISSALLMNLMIWPRIFPPKLPLVVEKPQSSDHVQYERYPPPLPPPPTLSVPEYSGRYNTDFTPLRCLGRGGFGVVFEVRNNIDHCSYALKRITLPNKESKRERVLREVRALAKLDHINIVRYFNAWVERSPPDWQMQRDKALIRELESASTLSDDYTSTPFSSPAKSPKKGDSVILNLQKFDSDVLHFDKVPEPSRRNRSLSCSDSVIFDSKAPVDHSVLESNRNSIIGSGSQDQTEAKNSFDKRLERVKECDYDNDTTASVKKKKGHTRHWSLDACVKTPDPPLYLYIQMQLCRRDSLHDWLRNNRTVDKRPPKQIKSLFSQIVSAVDYVHNAGLIHRDLKPSNILFSQDGTVKVGDFGLVTSMGDTSQDGERYEETDAEQRHTYRVGTHLYMSPEQAQCRPYSYKVDIYSLGLILLEMLQPFGTEAERVRCLRDARHGVLPPGLRTNHPEESKALDLMLSESPTERPTAAGVRARAPLQEVTDPRYHFSLPPVC